MLIKTEFDSDILLCFVQLVSWFLLVRQVADKHFFLIVSSPQFWKKINYDYTARKTF